MPELTIVACPTCGLPAEILWVFQEDVGSGPVEHARTRCVMLHVGTVPTGNTSPRPRAARAAPIAVPTGREPLIRTLVREWRGPLAWMGMGSLATLLSMLVPMAGVFVALLSLPVAAILRARKSWKPLFGPVALAEEGPEITVEALTEHLDETGDEAGRQAA